MEKYQNIAKTLSDIGENYENQKDFLKEYLYRIESIIDNTREQQEQAIEFLSKKPFSVKSIAEELDISRTTMYNYNQLLMRYIENSKEELEKNNPFNEIKKLREKIENLNDKLSKMYARDINCENLKSEIILSQEDAKAKNAEIIRLNKRIHELSAENHALKVGQLKEGSTPDVVKFKRKER